MPEQLQTTIFLVRHGETDRIYNTDPSVDGKRSLTEKGEQQMKAVGEYLHDFAPVAILSSPLHRTRQCAEIIKKEANIPGEVEVRDELVEIYTDASYRAIFTRMPDLCHDIVRQHSGKQIVCISHQDAIEGMLVSLEVSDDEAELPCRMADVYRLVFAGEAFVQCTKLQPAKEIS